jgi:hypothetical protein
VQIQEETPLFLLIVRERLRPGCEEAYDTNEVRLAAVCAKLQCPHPYLALASTAGPKEVWWLNAFASQEERDGLDAAYARNEPLMAAMRPLGKRKEDFRASGAVFETSDGDRFVIASTQTRADADDLVTRSGPGAKIFEVQPHWSFPAGAWIKADPTFWQTSPASQLR